VARLRTAVFFTGTITSVGPTTAFTVPSGHRYIVRSILLSNQSGSATGVTIQVGSTVQVLAHTLAIVGASGSDFTYQPWLVLDQGTVCKVFGQASRSFGIVISGTDLLI
jgi:hypothetical protein